MDPKIKQKALMLGLISFLFVGILGLWTLDVSVTILNSQKCFEEYSGEKIEATTTNGFIENSPEKSYHMGVWAVLVSFFAFSIITVSSLMHINK